MPFIQGGQGKNALLTGATYTGALVQVSCYQHRCVSGVKDPYSSAAISTDMNECLGIYIRLSLESSCIYWCWCSVLGDFIISADSLSTSLESITLKAGGGEAWVALGDCGSVVRAPAAKAEGPGSDSQGFFFSSNWPSNVYGAKTLWCSSTVQLLSTQI